MTGSPSYRNGETGLRNAAWPYGLEQRVFSMVAQDTTGYPIDTTRLPGSAPAKLRSMRGQSGVLGDMLHRLGVELGLKLNGSFYYPSEDRSILECLIIPYFQVSPEHRSILFVGTDWYTQGYTRMFGRKQFATIDAKPAAAAMAARTTSSAACSRSTGISVRAASIWCCATASSAGVSTERRTPRSRSLRPMTASGRVVT